jgi:type II secretory pathway pseudopilin PulG
MVRTELHRRPGARSGFTAIELMVVISIVILLVAMTVPSIYPAIRKGRVHDAANSIMRVASQARQLARTRSGPPTVALYYGVAVVVPSSGSAYAVLIYDTVPAGSMNASSIGLTTQYNTNQYVSKQTFNANVMPFNAISGGGGPGSKAVYTLQQPGTVVAWYYQYRTGFVIASGATSTTLGNVGTPSIPANTATGTPAIATIGPTVFGVCSLDQQYCVALSIYSVGLANAQDLF